MNYNRTQSTGKRTWGIILIVLGVLLLANQIRVSILSDYNYEKNYTQLWELADKSSTIPAKEKYIVTFVETLKHGKSEGQFADNDAIWLKTPNNNFDANLAAVETLAQRLKEIQTMDPKTFEYNTAIQQITAQEQGQASHLMSVFKGCYLLQNYPIVWGVDWWKYDRFGTCRCCRRHSLDYLLSRQ